MTGQIPTYGLIGYPLTHSFSKKYFTEKFAEEHIHAQYQNFELPNIQAFGDLIKEHTELKGLNVTIPYKESIIPFLDALSPDAKAIGAVNCIAFKNDQLIGYNTDHLGFSDMLKPALEASHQSALIFGSGGSSKAVQFALKQLNISFTVLSRKGANTYEYASRSLFENHKIWINCTPIGMYPNENEQLAIPFEAASTQHLIIDLIYNPAETLLLKNCKQQGAKVLNGFEMLIFQANHAWDIWNKNL